MVVGPTGCCKTEIARRLAKPAEAPFIKVGVVDRGWASVLVVGQGTVVQSVGVGEQTMGNFLTYSSWVWGTAAERLEAWLGG